MYNIYGVISSIVCMQFYRRQMDENVAQKLHEVFGHFSDSPEGIDGPHFARLCRDLNLELASHNGTSLVSATTFDLIFARSKSRGRRRLDFNQFLIALDMVGQRLNLSIEEIIRAVCTIRTDDHLTRRGGESKTSQRGPEKFYYDVSTYTGTQAYRTSRRGAEESPTSSARIIDLKDIVNRDHGEKWVSTPQTGTTTMRRPLTAPFRNDDSTPVRGPERFYYDRATYTGIHKHTPSRTSKSLGEYNDENATPTPMKQRSHLKGKREKAAPTLPETAAGTAVNTPYATTVGPKDITPYMSLVPIASQHSYFCDPVALTADEFLAAELELMPVGDFFSSFLRR